MFKKLVSIGAAGVIVFATAAPSHATTGQFTYPEFSQLCIAASSCPGDTQNSSEDICSCTGDRIDQWTDEGYDNKVMAYKNTSHPHGVQLHFRRSMFSTGPWKLRDASWQD